MTRLRQFLAAALLFSTLAATAAQAADPRGFLESVHRHVTLASTVSGTGDQNPYALVVVPASIGKLRKDDVLVDNFNGLTNLQGTGASIVAIDPAARTTMLFAQLPQHLPQCPGGVGLSTAMAVLRSGWVIIGSTPSTDGTTRTKGAGCLLVLDANGQLVATWAGPDINGPWGNMAVVDRGDSATLFVSMAGFDVPGPEIHDLETGFPVTIDHATVLRLDLALAAGRPPEISRRTVIANGFGQRADRDAFLIGPTGVALSADQKTLYVSDALANRVVAIADPLTRTTSAGTGREVTRDGLLRRPLAMLLAPNGHLLVCNAKNGQIVEIDPASGQQIYAQWIDTDAAQSPPGNGDLFGIAMLPDGKGFYYVEDDMNTLMVAR